MSHKQHPIQRIKRARRLFALSFAWQGLLSLCVIAVVSAPVSAQPLINTVASIDSLVINADYVYVARIIKVRDEPIPGGSKMPGFSFQVEEYLKSPMHEDLTPEIKQRGMFVAPPTTNYKDWMRRGCRLLIVSNDATPDRPTIIELTPTPTEVFTADLRLLRESKQIIHAAKAAIKRTPTNVRRLCTHRFLVPRKLLKETRWEREAGLMLEVPADEQLEKRAVKFLSDKDPGNRLQAVQSLRYFKSERNVKLVAKLLNDPVSNVRDAAIQTLKRWEIEVKRARMHHDKSNP